MLTPKDSDLIVVTAAYMVAGGAALAAGAVGRHAGLDALWTAAVADLAATVAVFAFSLVYRNSSMYDAYWSVAPPALAAWFWLAAGAPVTVRAGLVGVVVLWWGWRLTYSWARGWPGMHHEDWRYVDIRAKTGRMYWPVSLLGIHVFPTLQVFLGCLPLWVALGPGRPLGWLDAVAFALAAGAVALELVADRQLHEFRGLRQPGRTLTSGVWGWSRHPNYVGEIGFWWGLYLFAVAADPSRWWTGVGALAITAMFHTVSVPMIEARHAARRPTYATDTAGIPVLWPRPPRAR